VRRVPGQLERPERAGQGKVPFIVDVALVADAHHRMLAHQVLDEADKRGIEPGTIDADQLGGKQRVQGLYFDAHADSPFPNGFN
jgi:hypothetical protein